MRKPVIVLGLLVSTCLLWACPPSVPELCDNGACAAPDGGGSSSGGGDGGDGGIIQPPGCDLTKEPKDSPACIDDGVGVFVSPSGSDGAAGTKASPVRSIGKALSMAGAKRVYVCEGSYGGFEVKSGTTIAGGFGCRDWKPNGSRAKVQGTEGARAAVELVSANAAVLLDLEILGPAQGAPNSVALRAVDTTATLRRVKVAAGDGADGADGTRTDFNYPAQADLNGNDASGANGGGEKSYTCPGGAVTKGGKGGDSGFSGDPGMPALGGGAGGMLAQPCAGNGTGSDGNGGSAPVAADGAKSLGTLDASVWLPQGGANGPHGSPGQGGGGGQGSGGGGGGSGGAGGCGGAGGGGGKGGGASIALLSVSSNLTVESSELVSAKAGNGGKGVGGQPGQPLFGGGGNRVVPGCVGGNGGKGGDGAAGGGGAGGLSTPVLYKGAKPTLTQTTATPGTRGSGGVGGAPGTNDGLLGEAKPDHEVK